MLQKRNYQIAFMSMAAVSLGLVLCVVWLSSRIRYVVYPIEVDRLGYALAMPQPLTPVTGDVRQLVGRMERYEVALYIRDARSVSNDQTVEAEAMANLLAHTHGPANNFLSDYYHADSRAHDPFVVAQKYTVTVQIDSILPLSTNTWQVRWTEQERDRTGSATSTATHWEAQLQTEQVEPKTAASIISNPIGFFVRGIDWTQEQ